MAIVAGFGLGAVSIHTLHAQAKPPVYTVVALEGAPAKRLAIQQWESMEKAKAWQGSKEYKENRKIGDKYAKFRILAVEGAM